jgi:predicted TIM-barrel fold metal-dependent hydrolase
MPLIDVHTHLYPKEVWRDPRQWGEDHGEQHWSNCVAPLNAITIQGWADLDTLIRDMDIAEIEKVVLLGWYWENQQTCEEQNRWYAQAIREHPDRLIAFAAINATSGQAATDSIDKAVELGFRGLGECLPQVQGHTLRDECWLKVVEKATEADLLINLHVTEPIGHDYAGKVETPLEDYVWLAETFPDTTFILAHWGGLLPLYELNPSVRHKMANVFYDTAASPLIYNKKVFRTVLDVIGPDRILYGSDYPLRLYPAEMAEPNFTTFLKEIRSANMTPDEEDALLYNNARRLFG